MPRLSWPGSIGVAVLVGVPGVVVAGWVASCFASWYAWSQFEGAAGYAVVGLALLGGIVALVAALIVARTLGTGAHPFLRALGLSLGLLSGTAGALAAGGRLLADVAPELDGEEVHVVVEARWPAGWDAPPPAQPVEIRLGALSMGGVRVAEPGLLWTDAARRVDGRWTAAGVVPLFTERGGRVVDVVLDSAAASHPRFDLALGRSPTAADTAWSAWLRPRPGAAHDVELRWRVLPRRRVVRTDTIGRFAAELVVRGFSWRTAPDGALELTADGTFALRHRGAVVRLDRPRAPVGDTGSSELHAVASLGGRPALLVAAPGWGDDGVALVFEEDGQPRVRHVSGGAGWELEALPATNDAARFHQAPRRARLGRPDRRLLAEPGLYVVGDALLDTRTLAVHPLPTDTSLVVERSSPPLALSPDERAVVRYAERPAPIAADGDLSTLHDADGAGPQPLLLVADVASGRTTTMPIDRARMRYPDPAELDPTWIAHHFAWTRDADGAMRLVERTGFAPLPHRGRVTEETRGRPHYWLAPGTERLRAALVALLVAEFDGTELEPSAGGYAHRIGVGDRVVSISLDEGSGLVGVALELGEDGQGLVRRIAERFDAELATGRHDGAFRE